VSVGSRAAFVLCQGTGDPTVILDAGLGGDHRQWSRIQASLARGGRVCSYDRAAVGGTEAGEEPTASSVTHAEDLRAILDAAGVDGPLVLVGWSYGGMVARAFAAATPDRVAGVVLVDTPGPGVFAPGTSDFDGETLVDLSMSAEQFAAAPRLGRVPLVVISHGGVDHDVLFGSEAWARAQAALPALSDESLHVVADTSHAVPAERPGVVVRAAEVLRDAVRRSAPLPPCRRTFRDVPGATCAAR